VFKSRVPLYRHTLPWQSESKILVLKKKMIE